MVLGAHEEDAAAGAGRERAHELVLGVDVGDLEDVVGHRGDVRGGLVDRVQHLVVEEALDELVDAVVERRREQQALAVRRASCP